MFIDELFNYFIFIYRFALVWWVSLNFYGLVYSILFFDFSKSHTDYFSMIIFCLIGIKILIFYFALTLGPKGILIGSTIGSYIAYNNLSEIY